MTPLEKLRLHGKLRTAVVDMRAASGLKKLNAIKAVNELCGQLGIKLGGAASAPAQADKGGELTTAPMVLYRSMSPAEWEDVKATGRITGGGNTFSFDNRRLVFFSGVLDADLIRQGEDVERGAQRDLMQSPINAQYEERQRAYNELQTRMSKMLASGKNQFSPEYRKLYQLSIQKNDELIELKKRAHAELPELRKKRSEYAASAGYTSVVIQTKPLTGLYEYSGKHAAMKNAEYGAEPGQVKLSDIAKVTFYKNGKEFKQEALEDNQPGGAASVPAQGPAAAPGIDKTPIDALADYGWNVKKGRPNAYTTLATKLFKSVQKETYQLSGDVSLRAKQTITDNLCSLELFDEDDAVAVVQWRPVDNRSAQDVAKEFNERTETYVQVLRTSAQKENDESIDALDKVFTFEHATTAFKKVVGYSVLNQKPDLSIFETAKAFELAAKRNGAVIYWDVTRNDRLADGEDWYGLLKKDGKVVARLQIGGDGTPSVFMGSYGADSDYISPYDEPAKQLRQALDKHVPRTSPLDNFLELGWRRASVNSVQKDFEAIGIDANGQPVDGYGEIRLSESASKFVFTFDIGPVKTLFKTGYEKGLGIEQAKAQAASIDAKAQASVQKRQQRITKLLESEFDKEKSITDYLVLRHGWATTDRKNALAKTFDNVQLGAQSSLSVTTVYSENRAVRKLAAYLPGEAKPWVDFSWLITAPPRADDIAQEFNRSVDKKVDALRKKNGLQAPAPAPVVDNAAQAHLAALSDIAAGKRDKQGIEAVYATIKEAVEGLQELGQLDANEDLANRAIDHWAALEKQA